MTDSEKLDLILSKMNQMEAKMNQMEAKMNQMEAKMNQMEAEINQLKSDVREVKLTIENEIRVNIQRIAEGHLDLSRNLHEALEVETEKEMISVRVSVLESEMRKVKERLQIA